MMLKAGYVPGFLRSIKLFLRRTLVRLVRYSTLFTAIKQLTIN
jgi:hypothetical protein